MNIYEIEQNYKNLEEVLENTEDENLAEIIKNSMAELEDTLNRKAENIVKFAKNLRGQAEVIKNEAKRLSDRQKSLEKKADNLEKYLFDSMKFANKEKIEAGIFEVSIKKNPVSVKITDETLIPDTFFKLEKKLDKASLKTMLKDGWDIKGAELEQKEVLKVK